MLDLYATRLPIGQDTVVELTHRTDAGAVRVELALATAEPDAAGAAPPYTYLPVPAGTGDGWRTSAVGLTGLSGTVHAIGVRLTAADGGPVRWRLGGLAVHDRAAIPAAPSGPRITAASGGDLRLAWNHPAPGTVRHYALHRVLPDGTRRFLGGTCQRAYFVGGLTPAPGERAVRFEVRAVGELYTSSAPATVTHPW